MKTDEMGFGGLKIVQDPSGFKYGVDAVLLADFASRISKNPKYAADLCAGNGAVSLILSYKMPQMHITAVEIQGEAAQLAVKSVILNGLEDRIAVINADIRDLCADYKKEDCKKTAAQDAKKNTNGEFAGRFDIVVMNPPYIPREEKLTSASKSRAIARHELNGSLKDFLKVSSCILCDGGDLFIIHRPARLADILCFAREQKLEAKTMRLVAPRKGDDFNQVLVHFRKNAGKELRVLPPLYIYEGRKYTDEILAIYGKNN